MNKKVLTLCAGALLAGGVSLAYVAPVNAALPAITAVTAEESETAVTLETLKEKPGVTVSDNEIYITQDINLGDGYLLVDEEGVKLIGTGTGDGDATFFGRIIITAEDVTVDNLKIVLENKAGNARTQKNTIVVYASSATITNNSLKAVEVEGKLANGISIFPKTADATFTVSGNTISNVNTAVDSWSSNAIAITQGIDVSDIPGAESGAKSAVLIDFDPATISNNTFENCACDYLVTNKSLESDNYSVVSVTPIKNEDGSYANQTYINSLVNNTTDGAEVIFNGTSETLLDALSKATDRNFSEETSAVQCKDAEGNPVNIIFGDEPAPNDNPSYYPTISSEGKVTSTEQPSALKEIGGYALISEAPADGYYMLAVYTGSQTFVVNNENKIEEFDASMATNPKYLWKMTGSQNKVTKAWEYQFQNKANPEHYLSANATVGTGINGSFSSKSGAAYADGLYMNLNSNNGSDLNNGEGADKYYYWGLYESGEKAFTAEFLNDIEGSSFALTITANRKNPDELLGAEAFDSSIIAEPINNEEEANATSYRFRVGDKYIVLDTKSTWSKDEVSIIPGNKGYKFTTVDVDNKDLDDRYKSVFTVYYSAGEETTVDDEGKIVPTAKTAIERIVVNGMTISTYNSAGKDYLTVSTDEDNYAKITFGGSKRADIAELLTGQFVNIQFVNKLYKEDGDGNVIAGEKYKKDNAGVLAIEENKNDLAEYVPAANVLLSSPEAQWAIQYVADGTKGKATFVNRENPDVKVESVTLYETDEKDVYAVTGVGSSNSNVTAQDTIKLTFVKNHTKFDGFKVVDVEALPDTVYNIAAYKAINNVNDAYWVEKNHSTTHQIGLDGDIENAGEWNLHVATKKLVDEDGDYVKNAKDEYVYVPDTVFVVSEMSYIDPKTKAVASDFKKDTLAILPYAIQNNDNNEFVKYDGTHGVEYYVADKDNKVNPGTEYMSVDKKSIAPANNFALKMKPDGTYQIVTLTNIEKVWTGDNNVGMNNKVYAGSAANAGILGKTTMYAPKYNDWMLITPVAMPEYRPVVKANESAFDTVRIYRDENHSQLLYEKKDQKSGISFLNIDNENQFKLADAIFVDTAYVNRGNNTRWQYLLVVEPNNQSDWYCPMQPEHNTDEWREANGVEHCHDAIRKNYVEGRFLVNLMDTANVYETTIQHENPYVNEVEAGVFQAKLAFVPGKHFGDTLVIYKDEAMTQVKDSLYLGDKDFNIAKFAFRYEDNATGSFKIQTQWKNWKDGDLREETVTSNEGYLRWENGTVVVAPSYEEGDVFNMTENYTEGNPTANESITAEGAVSVVATDGAVVIKGAEGKNVVIATILGKVVANETVNSDNETIAVPAGIAVVSVDGESFKVVVK